MTNFGGKKPSIEGKWEPIDIHVRTFGVTVSGNVPYRQRNVETLLLN